MFTIAGHFRSIPIFFLSLNLLRCFFERLHRIRCAELLFVDAAAVGALTQGSSGAASAIAAFERGNVTTEQLTQEIANEAKLSTRLLVDIFHVLERDPEKLVTLGT